VSANRDAAHEALTKAHAALDSGNVDKALSLAMKVREWPAVSHAPTFPAVIHPRHACTTEHESQPVCRGQRGHRPGQDQHHRHKCPGVAGTRPSSSTGLATPWCVECTNKHVLLRYGDRSAKMQTCCHLSCHQSSAPVTPEPRAGLAGSAAAAEIEIARIEAAPTHYDALMGVCVACRVRLACGVAAAFGLVS
jgi:hypothetical protein